MGLDLVAFRSRIGCFYGHALLQTRRKFILTRMPLKLVDLEAWYYLLFLLNLDMLQLFVMFMHREQQNQYFVTKTARKVGDDLFRVWSSFSDVLIKRPPSLEKKTFMKSCCETVGILFREQKAPRTFSCFRRKNILTARPHEQDFNGMVYMHARKSINIYFNFNPKLCIYSGTMFFILMSGNYLKPVPDRKEESRKLLHIYIALTWRRNLLQYHYTNSVKNKLGSFSNTYSRLHCYSKFWQHVYKPSPTLQVLNAFVILHLPILIISLLFTSHIYKLLLCCWSLYECGNKWQDFFVFQFKTSQTRRRILVLQNIFTKGQLNIEDRNGINTFPPDVFVNTDADDPNPAPGRAGDRRNRDLPKKSSKDHNPSGNKQNGQGDDSPHENGDGSHEGNNREDDGDDEDDDSENESEEEGLPPLQVLINKSQTLLQTLEDLLRWPNESHPLAITWSPNLELFPEWHYSLLEGSFASTFRKLSSSQDFQLVFHTDVCDEDVNVHDVELVPIPCTDNANLANHVQFPQIRQPIPAEDFESKMIPIPCSDDVLDDHQSQIPDNNTWVPIRSSPSQMHLAITTTLISMVELVNDNADDGEEEPIQLNPLSRAVEETQPFCLDDARDVGPTGLHFDFDDDDDIDVGATGYSTPSDQGNEFCDFCMIRPKGVHLEPCDHKFCCECFQCFQQMSHMSSLRCPLCKRDRNFPLALDKTVVTNLQHTDT